MVRAVTMSAVSALCLIWAAGCAGTTEPASKAAPPSASANTGDAAVDSKADIAALANNLPGTLDGEIQRADLLRGKGDFDEAARSFAQLLLVAPDDARVVGGYGKVLEQQGHSKEAQAFLSRAVQLNPHDWSLQSALGIADDQLDDHKSARAAYERALALKPGDATVLNNYAVSLMLAGDYSGAKRMLAQAEARGVSNPKLALNLEKLASLDDVPVASASTLPKPAPNLPPAAAATAKVNPVTIANLPSPPVQTTPAKAPPKATVAAAIPAPRKAPAPAGTRIATAAPKPLSSGVVMETVPADPLAGPVKHRDHPAQKLVIAAHQPAKPAAPKAAPAAVAPPPALRTAADGD
ncbi:MAG TPA: tetratricopeptide repeat protein [Rhizomicrobium sp.]|jgi:Flp pilus assembly protein TadD|nr:tetratricopeptide repeat protein [Rhizomicrobium sp.]